MDTHSTTPPTQRRRWAPVAVAAGAALLVLLAVGLPVLFLSGDESIVAEPSTTTAASTTTVASTTVTPTTTPPTTVQPTPAAPAEVVPFPASDLAVLEVPLSEAVPGFSDTIVMSAWSDNDHRVMRWRSSESMTELLLPPGFNGDGWWVGLDASAHWVGQTFDDDVLSVQAVPTVPGEPSRREIGEHDVPGISHVVWHDTEPGHLAWLECLNLRDGPTTVVTLDASDPSADPIRVRSFDQGCPEDFWGDDESDAGKPAVTVERWGSTGVWVAKWAEDAEGQDVIESVLLDADGAEIATVSDARVIAVSQDGTSIWRPVDWEDPCFVLSPDGQQRSAVPGIAAEDFIYGARWSPDATRFAMSVDTGGGFRSADGVLRIVDSVSGEVITEIAEPALDAWGSTLAWSTDSRFLVYELVYEGVPSTDTAVLVIHDTVTNTTRKIPLSEYVDEIRVR